MPIEITSNRNLLDWYKDWVQIYHYEPCDPYQRPLFSQYEIQDEILRRMKDFDYLDNR